MIKASPWLEWTANLQAPTSNFSNLHKDPVRLCGSAQTRCFFGVSSNFTTVTDEIRSHGAIGYSLRES